MKESRRSSLRATAIQSEPRIAAQVRIASVSLKPVRPRRAACVYGKAEGPFHPKGPAGGWCGTGSGELWIFLPRNRIICQVENSLYLDRRSAMNASLLKCVVKSGGPPDAVQPRQRMQSGG